MPRATAALRVRMYRVGFGDCFLLSVSEGQQASHVLVDCGVHPSGDIGTLDRVLDDVEQVTGRRLALLVASHEHADHISGFGRFRDRFAAFEIGEIWMPWAMDPDDRIANGLRAHRLQLVQDLTQHLAAVGGPPEVSNVLLNASASSNQVAIQALRSGFGGAARTVRYLKANDPVTLPGAQGLEARVLGPPTDPTFLKRMDPPAAQRFLRMKAQGSEPVNPVEPFARKWESEPAAARKLLGFTLKDAADLRRGLLDSMWQLAFALDSVLNNTSLVLLLAFRGRTLLFPGDAQWGNWQSWLEASGSDVLLSRLSFLKVAHHGSHNATPRRALDGMTTGGFAAMVSTQSKPWKSIPRGPLLQRLSEKTLKRYVRSDSLLVDGAPSGPPLPERLPSGFRRGELWLDFSCRL